MEGLDSEGIVEFFEKKNLPSILGSEKFVQWVKHKYFERKKHNEVPQSLQLAPTIAEIKEAVMRSFDISEQDLSKTIRGQVNEARNLAIYLARKLSRQRLRDISKEFDLGSYSSVSSVVARTELLLSQSKSLRNKLDKIKKELGKSQAKT